ncbi:MAG: ISKra4 family transposase ISCep1 [Chroococcidiopsis sp. SAG 2025]|nr:tyrosine-type recombinase/integrase [Chroococcidiopsis sp. SAG 2025]MDV2998308.1 ISKra4 family transposase ISCep1 [Chroococcidiopsis sp. SAG 2025]
MYVLQAFQGFRSWNNRSSNHRSFGKTEKLKHKSPNSRKYEEIRIREHLLPEEVSAMRSAIKKFKGRHAHRDSTIILLCYRHGLRVAEVASLRWEQIDWNGGTIYVKRVKKGTSSVQPLSGLEIRSLRQMQRDYPASPYIFQSSRRSPLASDTIAGIVERAGKLAGLPFPVHAHMLRHGTGYYLANRGIDTRTIQSYLGHKNIQHTVRYTELASTKFHGLWDD